MADLSRLVMRTATSTFRYLRLTLSATVELSAVRVPTHSPRFTTLSVLRAVISRVLPLGNSQRHISNSRKGNGMNVTQYLKPWSTLIVGIILGVVVYPRVKSKIG